MIQLTQLTPIPPPPKAMMKARKEQKAPFCYLGRGGPNVPFILSKIVVPGVLLHSSAGKASHRYCGSHGLESRTLTFKNLGLQQDFNPSPSPGAEQVVCCGSISSLAGFKFYFPLFSTHYHTLPESKTKGKLKDEIEPHIYNMYMLNRKRTCLPLHKSV